MHPFTPCTCTALPVAISPLITGTSPRCSNQSKLPARATFAREGTRRAQPPNRANRRDRKSNDAASAPAAKQQLGLHARGDDGDHRRVGARPPLPPAPYLRCAAPALAVPAVQEAGGWDAHCKGHMHTSMSKGLLLLWKAQVLRGGLHPARSGSICRIPDWASGKAGGAAGSGKGHWSCMPCLSPVQREISSPLLHQQAHPPWALCGPLAV